jgi:hypothetical protein
MAPRGNRSVADNADWASAGEKLRIPIVGTSACRTYFAAWNQIWGFYTFAMRTAEELELDREILHSCLVARQSDGVEEDTLADRWQGPDSPLEFLALHRQFLLEIVLVRHVENYLTYLWELLFEIYTARPETLRSGREIKHEEVFAHDTMEDLVRTVAEGEVQRRSYESFETLSQYFANNFHLTLLLAEEMPLVVDAIETRNISVHNRCIINRQYIKNTGADESLLGKVRELSIAEVEGVAELLADGVATVDTAARTKYDLTSYRFDETLDTRTPE